MDWRPIETVPKDGSCVKLAWFEGIDGPFDVCADMRWDSLATNSLVGDAIGLWVHKSGGFTWCDSNGGGPTHWQ